MSEGSDSGQEPHFDGPSGPLVTSGPVMTRTKPRDQNLWRDVDSAWVLTAELLSATLVWGGFGWLVDRYVFHSEPWAMVTGLVLGFALGTYLLYLRMMEAGRAEDEARRQRSGLPPRSDRT